MLSPHTFVGTMSAEPAPSLLLSKPYLPSLHVHPHASIRFRGSAAVVACLLWLWRVPPSGALTCSCAQFICHQAAPLHRIVAPSSLRRSHGKASRWEARGALGHELSDHCSRGLGLHEGRGEGLNRCALRGSSVVAPGAFPAVGASVGARAGGPWLGLGGNGGTKQRG